MTTLFCTFINFFVFNHVLASQMYNNMFRLGACSSANYAETHFMTSSNVYQCSFTCLDDCLGFVVFNTLNKDEQCSNVRCLPSDLMFCGNSKTSKNAEFYLKMNKSEVISSDYNDNSNTNSNSCPVIEEQQFSTEIIIFNNWLLVRDSVSNQQMWIIIQRRASKDVNFYRTWNHYKHGFGKLAGNFWIGLETIHYFCSRQCDLRFDFEYKGKKYWAWYVVTVSGATENYKMRIDKDFFSGNATDNFAFADGMAFTTKDKDNDRNDDYNCAERFSGAWWYNDCHTSNLNGKWGSTKEKEGLNWFDITGIKDSATFSQIKVRPVQDWINLGLGA